MRKYKKRWKSLEAHMHPTGRYYDHMGFCLAFIYFPTGTELHVGRYGAISDALKDRPTSHGFVRGYRGGMLWHSWWSLFGKETAPPTGIRSSNPDGRLAIGEHAGAWYDLIRASKVNPDRFPLTLQGSLTKRKYFYIVRFEVGRPHRIIHKWRKLPSKHLIQLDDNYEKKQNKERKSRELEL